MRFSIDFDTDNAAFEDGMATEISRILRSVADKVEQGEMPEWPNQIRKIYDVNGNHVGNWGIG